MWKRATTSDLSIADAQRICVIKPSALGDIVQSLPFLSALRERFPRASISWVIKRQFADLLTGHPQLNDVLVFNSDGGIPAFKQLARDLRSKDFDVVFDLQGLFRTAAMSFATRAPLRVGLETAREGAHLPCHVLISDTGRHVPAHVRYWRVAQALGMGHLRPTGIVPVTDAHRRFAVTQLAGINGAVLAIHAGAGWVTKRWPVEKFAVVAAKAIRRFGGTTVLLGTQAEAELTTQLEGLIRRFVPTARVINLAGKTSILELAAVLERCTSVLTNDSGPMHLAAAVGTPVIGVFTSTDAVRSGPPEKHHALVSTQLACAACYKKQCRYSGRRHLKCLDEVAIERVWDSASAVMERELIAARKAA